MNRETWESGSRIKRKDKKGRREKMIKRGTEGEAMNCPNSAHATASSTWLILPRWY